jgi:hypothetical protein
MRTIYESLSKISLLSDWLNILQASSSLAANITEKTLKVFTIILIITEGFLEMVSSTQIAAERICKIRSTCNILKKYLMI